MEIHVMLDRIRKTITYQLIWARLDNEKITNWLDDYKLIGWLQIDWIINDYKLIGLLMITNWLDDYKLIG